MIDIIAISGIIESENPRYNLAIFSSSINIPIDEIIIHTITMKKNINISLVGFKLNL